MTMTDVQTGVAQGDNITISGNAVIGDPTSTGTYPLTPGETRGRVQFRCPHRPWRVPNDKSRDEKAAARRTLYVVPADAEWTRVDEEYDPDKSVQRKVNGKVIRSKLYEHESGHRWETEVRCPDCGDTILVSTDQDPEQSTTFDAAIALAEAQRVEAERAAAEVAERAAAEVAAAQQPPSEA